MIQPILHKLLMPLESAIELLPNTCTGSCITLLACTQEMLGFDYLRSGGNPSIRIGSFQIALTDLREILIDVNGYHLITPNGARTLIGLYDAGALPMLRRKTREIDSPSLRRLQVYAESHDDLIALSEDMRAETRRKEQWRQAMINVPSNLPPSEFNASILSDIFFVELGVKAGELEIGGLIVKKIDIRAEGIVQSVFEWNNTDGTTQKIVAPPVILIAPRSADEEPRHMSLAS